jgi:hypothetical protein
VAWEHSTRHNQDTKCQGSFTLCYKRCCHAPLSELAHIGGHVGNEQLFPRLLCLLLCAWLPWILSDSVKV